MAHKKFYYLYKGLNKFLFNLQSYTSDFLYVGSTTVLFTTLSFNFLEPSVVFNI